VLAALAIFFSSPEEVKNLIPEIMIKMIARIAAALVKIKRMSEASLAIPTTSPVAGSALKMAAGGKTSSILKLKASWFIYYTTPLSPIKILSTIWVIAKARIMITKPTSAKINLLLAAAAASGLPEEVIN